MRSVLFVVALLLAAPSWAASLPTPTLACNAGAVDDTTCDAVNGGLTITKPTHVVAEDLMVAECNSTGTVDSLSGGATWNAVAAEITTATFHSRVFQKIVGDAEPATYTLAVTGGGGGAAESCIVSAFSGIAQTSPVDTYGSTTGNGTAMTLPTITTAADNALIYGVCVNAGAGTSTEATYTEELDGTGFVVARSLKATAGATGTEVFTASITGDYACWHIAFKYNTTGTRLYLPSSGAPGVSPTFDASWEDSDQADRILAVFTRGATAMTSHTSNEETADTTAKDHLNRQYSIQIGAQTISGVVQCNMRTIESNTLANEVAGIKIWLADSAGTSTSEVLLDMTNAGNSTDEYNAVTAAARNFPTKARTHTVTSQTSSNNDYLVIELGTYYNNTSSTARTDIFRYGDTAATALDRDDVETTDNHPWCDFLDGLSAPAAGACAQSIALMGVGCR